MRQGLVILLFLLTNTANNKTIAQRNLFTTYSINEGLVHNAIRSIHQDNKGFIWISTWEGLSKYDGNKFINYTTVNGLSHALVNELIELPNGDIYIAENDGSIDLMNKTGRLRKVNKEKIVINHFFRLPGKKIIATTDKYGLVEFQNGKLIKPVQPYPNDNYYHITRFNDSLLLLQSDYSIQLIDQHYQLYAEHREPDRLYAESALFTDSHNRIWVGTNNGLRLLSSKQSRGKPLQFERLPAPFDLPILKQTWIKSLLEDASGNFWIGTYAGLFRIGPDGSHQLITEKNGLPASDISKVFQDREMNIWIGTSRGISKLVTKAGIRLYGEESGLNPNSALFILPQHKGKIIAGTENSIQRFDQLTGEFENLPLQSAYYSGENAKSKLALLFNKAIGHYFLSIEQNKGSWVRFSPASSGSFFAFKDSAGNYFYPSTEGIKYSKDFSRWETSLLITDCRTMLIDKNNDLWVGTQDSGLLHLKYQYANDTPRLVSLKNHFPSTGFRALYQDTKGFIWAGTRFDGVYRFNPDDPGGAGTLHFDQVKGLTSNRIVSIGEDKTGSIWLNFYHGLDKLVPSGNQYRVFNFSRCYNFFSNIHTMVFDHDQAMWLGTTQGLVNINDAGIDAFGPLPVFVTDAHLGDSIYRSQTDKKISLDYRHKPVKFDFASPGYINEKQLLFSYRLLGSNNTDWSIPANIHSVSFANLQPGSYQFEVRNKGWNGAWGEPARFAFSIRPPFWQQAWFIILMVLIIAAIIWLLVKRRVKMVRKESRLKQQIAETEMMALRAQMNPHFIFNCLNAIDNLVQTDQKEKATTYLSRFAKLIRAVLESSKNNLIPFQKDFESLQLYLQMEQFRCSNRFEYKLTADDELMNGDYKLPPLIVQPFVENAIHHGLLNKETNDRQLNVNASIDDDCIVYTITDNGIGRLKAAQLKQINKPEQRSYGIQITADRIHLYNQQYKSGHEVSITDLYEKNQPGGTKVIVRLKIENQN